MNQNAGTYVILVPLEYFHRNCIPSLRRGGIRRTWLIDQPPSEITHIGPGPIFQDNTCREKIRRKVSDERCVRQKLRGLLGELSEQLCIVPPKP